MRRNSMMWGAILILAGLLFLLNNLGILRVDVWGIFWPLVIIWFGVTILWNYFRPRSRETEHAVIPLEGARQGRLHLKHGAGRLRMSAGAAPDTLAEGDFGGGLDLNTRKDGDLLVADLSMPSMPAPWPGMDGLDWNLALNTQVPLSLDLETGAGESTLDLTDVAVTNLRLRSGASSTEVRLPARAGLTRVDLSTGAASVRLLVPQGVAASIQARGGLASIDVDQNRFPRMGDLFQSPDYATAANRVDIHAETGVGSIEVR